MFKRKKSPQKAKHSTINSTLSEITRNIQPNSSYKNCIPVKNDSSNIPLIINEAQKEQEEEYEIHEKKIFLKKIEKNKEKCSESKKKQTVLRAPILLQFKNYVVYDSILGEGAFSKVFLGMNKHTKNRVAVKQVQKLQENQVACLMHLQSSYIIKMYEFIQHKSYSYIILELCQSNLRDQLKRCSVNQGINYFQQIIQGMNHLNKKNIIHRDLKFQNILIKNGQVKISDFGFAKPIGQKMSVYSVKCGTPYTMAPQIYFHSGYGKPIYTHKCDIWSLGVILHQILYQKHPFDYSAQKLRLKKRCQIVKKYGYLNILIDKCLQFQPKNRCNWQQFLQIFSLFKIKRSEKNSNEEIQNLTKKNIMNKNKQNQLYRKQKNNNIHKPIPKNDFLLRYKKLKKYKTPQKKQEIYDSTNKMKSQTQEKFNDNCFKKCQKKIDVNWEPFMQIKLKSTYCEEKQQKYPNKQFEIQPSEQVSSTKLLEKYKNQIQNNLPQKRERRISCREKRILSKEELMKKQQQQNQKAVSLVKLVALLMIFLMLFTLGQNQIKNLRI